MVPCEECGKFTSSYQGATPVKCKRCRAKGRTCAKCGREFAVKHVGKVFDDGSAYCSNCVRGGKEMQICPNCGLETKHLSRDVNAGFHEPVCSTCRHRKRPILPCDICGNERHFYGVLDGKNLCHSCYEERQPTMCAVCGKVHVASARTICKDCEYKDFVRKSVWRESAKLRQVWCRNLYAEFIDAQLEAYGGYDTNLRRPKQFPLFLIMDNSFKALADITAESLMILLRMNDQKNYRLLYGYLVQRGIIIEFTIDEREDAIAVANIEAAIKRIEGKWYHQLILGFRDELMKLNERYQERGWVGRKRRFSLTTCCDNLLAGIRFCEFTKGISRSTEFEQEHVYDYLKVKRGTRDTLAHFLRYMKLRRKTFERLKLPPKKRKDINVDNILPTKKCNELIHKWLNPPDSEVKISLILLLMLLYAQRPRHIALMQLDHIFEKDGVYSIVIGKKKKLVLHDAMGNLLKRYFDLRTTKAMDDESNKYLFPGEYSGTFLSVDSIMNYPNRYGVSCRKLYATAVYRAVSLGIRIPNDLVSALGVSIKTATGYVGLLNEQMYQDVEDAY